MRLLMITLAGATTGAVAGWGIQKYVDARNRETSLMPINQARAFHEKWWPRAKWQIIMPVGAAGVALVGGALLSGKKRR